MNKLLIPVLASILIFGTMGLSYDAFADKDDNNGQTKGCENANERSKANEKNPHCDTGFTVCDVDGNGGIDAIELGTWFAIHGAIVSLEFTEELIQFIESYLNDEGLGATLNDLIDTQVELDELNDRLVNQFRLTPACT